MKPMELEEFTTSTRAAELTADEFKQFIEATVEWKLLEMPVIRTKGWNCEKKSGLGFDVP
jgi:hypothetical protein